MSTRNSFSNSDQTRKRPEQHLNPARTPKKKHHTMAARDEPADPSLGGSRGYAPEARRQTLALYAAGRDDLSQASSASAYRWMRDPGRQQQRGGRQATNLRGYESWLITIFRTAWPKATADEVRAFILRQTGNLYSRQDVSKRERELGFTRKRGSTLAFQALLPAQLMRRHRFWNWNFPYGIANVPTNELIDVDEAGVRVQDCNQKYGKAPQGVRVVMKGNYEKGAKWTLIIAVSANGQVWYELEKIAGTSEATFRNFINRVCNTLQAGAGAA